MTIIRECNRTPTYTLLRALMHRLRYTITTYKQWQEQQSFGDKIFVKTFWELWNILGMVNKKE